jgi:hypothetical protein
MSNLLLNNKKMEIEEIFKNKGTNIDIRDIKYISLELLESKSSIITNELEKIKDLFKYILSLCK